MCPGNKIANFELLTMVVQLVQDWEFELEDASITSLLDIPYHQGTTVQPQPMPNFVFRKRRPATA